MIRFVRDNFAFLAIGLVLVVYVAACTRWRDEKLGADAWEHHRAILALVDNLNHTENPTFATPETSIRYSPYTVTQALICRATGLSAYNVLSGAAVLNTILMVAGVWLLLREFGEQASAASVLLVMVGLYGGAPGYANSYALSDLPWHQVNPSAFAFGLTLLTWALFLHSGKTVAGLIGVSVMVGISLLDHVMTGLFTMIGLLLFALTVPSVRGVRAVLSLAIITVGAAMICLVWPWYNFLTAARMKPDPAAAPWFNPAILGLMLTVWAWPAYLCGLAALFVRRPIIWIFLAGSVTCILISAADFVLKSPTFARLPLPAMIFLHVPIGVFFHEIGLFRPSTWPGRFRSLFRADQGEQVPAIVATMVGLIYLGSLAPQLAEIATAPHLARPYLAKLLRKPSKMTLYRSQLDQLLAKIGNRDVVLADPDTSWMVPSSRGRIMASIHYEFFDKNPMKRLSDLDAFLDPDASDAKRLEILKKYDVRWIVLNSDLMKPHLVDSLTETEAVVDRVGPLTLLDADLWAKRIRSRAERDHATVGATP